MGYCRDIIKLLNRKQRKIAFRHFDKQNFLLVPNASLFLNFLFRSFQRLKENAILF